MSGEEKTNSFKIDFENGIKVKLDCGEICNSINKLSNSIVEAALISSNSKYAEHIGNEKIEKANAEKAATEREREEKARAEKERQEQIDSLIGLIERKRQEDKDYNEWYTSFETYIDIIINHSRNIDWLKLICDQKLSEFFEKHSRIKEAFDEKEKELPLLFAILNCGPEKAANTLESNGETKNTSMDPMTMLLSGCDPTMAMLLNNDKIDPFTLMLMTCKVKKN